MKIEDVSLLRAFHQLAQKICNEHPLYKFNIPSTIIDYYLPNKLQAFTKITWKSLAKRFIFYSKPMISACRLPLRTNVEQLSNSISLSDVLEELLTENDLPTCYNFVLMGDCFIVTRVARFRHMPFYILCKHIALSNRSTDVRFAGELWYDNDNGFQFSNHSGTYQPSNILIEQTVKLFNYLTPELRFKGISFQKNAH